MTVQFASVDQALRKAKALSKKGAVSEAETAYRWVIDRFPGNRRALEELQSLRSANAAGRPDSPLPRESVAALVALHGKRRFAEALAQAQLLAVVHPHAAFLQNFLGICHAALGQTDLALARYRRALELAPDDAGIHSNLGDALNAANRPQKAAVCFRRAIELDPGTAKNHNNLGSALIKLGDVEGAAESFARAAAADPDLVDAHANFGLALIKLGRIEDGVAACRQAIRLDPGFPLAHVNLAHAHDAKGETEAAIECLETAIALKPGHAGAHSNLCEIFDRENRVGDMRAAVKRAREHCNPNDPRILYRTAQMASRDKDHATARALLERMLENGLTAAITKGRLTLLGKTCDKLDDQAAAFGWFERANAYVGASAEAQKLDPGSYRREVEQLTASFSGISGPPWDEAPDFGGRTPVFLVGFPRSGTTLLDTILRSHANIVVLEELPMVARMRAVLGEVAGHERLQGLSQDEIAALRKAYMEELETHTGDVADTTLVIDKLPLNIVQAGLINRVFPAAKFIFATRHPCDCVLSCFMQNFRLNNPMANFLDLESSAILYDRVMRLWTIYRNCLGLDVHRLTYEELVADMEGTVTPLLGFLGLEWDEALRDYRDTALARGRIRTPSYNQVTEKLYSRAAGRWEGYRQQLKPVLPLLEPWVRQFGY